MAKKTKKQAFTIVELVIVIAVIAILAAILIPTYSNLVKKANEATALVDAKNLITEMLADILSGDKDAADLIVFSKKGDSIFVYGYDASAGRVLTYHGHPITAEGDFAAQVGNGTETGAGTTLLGKMLGAGEIKPSNPQPTSTDDWRHPDVLNKGVNGGKSTVEELGFDKNTMAVFANYDINPDKFAKKESGGETCTHDWGTGVVTKEATCTEAGVKTFTCTKCNETKTETIAALGHDMQNEEAKEATCTEAGHGAGQKCSRCDYVTGTTVIPAKGHTEVTDPAVAATCTATGKTEGKHCSVCNAVLVAQNVTPALGHDYVNGTCSRCGDVLCAHTNTKTVVVAPTCIEGGKINTVCSDCGEIISSITDSNNPSADDTKHVLAVTETLAHITDVAADSKVYWHTGTCTVCNEVFDEKALGKIVGAALGTGRYGPHYSGFTSYYDIDKLQNDYACFAKHTMSFDSSNSDDVAQLTDYFCYVGTCSDCHQDLKALKATYYHTYDATTHKCVVCGTTDHTVCSHNYEVIAEKSSLAKCNARGTEYRKCTKCLSETKAITLKTDHHYSSYSSTDGESHTGTCADCGKQVTQLHFWKYDDLSGKYICSCGNEKTVAIKTIASGEIQINSADDLKKFLSGESKSKGILNANIVASENMTVNGSNLVLDLNGHSISLGNYQISTAEGSAIEITDSTYSFIKEDHRSSSNAYAVTGIITGSDSFFVVNSCSKVIVSGGVYNKTSKDEVFTLNGGELIINKGILLNTGYMLVKSPLNATSDSKYAITESNPYVTDVNSVFISAKFASYGPSNNETISAASTAYYISINGTVKSVYLIGFPQS